MAAVTHAVGTANTAVGPLTSGAFTPAANDLLVVFTIASDTNAQTAVTNSLGITFTRIETALYRTSLDAVQFFVADQLAAASSQTCTVTFPVDNSTGQIIYVARVSGMTRTRVHAVRQWQSQSNQSAGGTPAPAFTTAALTTNPCFGAIGNSTNPATVTPPASWTEGVADMGYATPTTGGEYIWRNSGFTGTTVTWGSTSASAFGSVIIELDASVPEIKDRIGGGIIPFDI